MPEPAAHPVPEGMSTVTAHLWFNGNCADAIEFYKEALGAIFPAAPIPSPDGGVWHAMMQVGDTNIMLADMPAGGWEHGPDGGTTVGFWTYVDDCDAWYERAVAAGCEVIDRIADMFWGDRMGKVKDPFGHAWVFATHKFTPTEEEMATWAE